MSTPSYLYLQPTLSYEVITRLAPKSLFFSDDSARALSTPENHSRESAAQDHNARLAMTRSPDEDQNECEIDMMYK